MQHPHHSHDHQHDHDHDHDHEGCCQPHASTVVMSDYSQHGVRFRFPSDWTLTEQSQGEETTISLQSDGTSFWALMLFDSRPDPEVVLETVVAAFEQDYEDVDVTSAIDSLNGMPSHGRDFDFICYDMLNSAKVRAFQTSDRTVMVMYQGTDRELEMTRDQLSAITSSLHCEDDEIDEFDDVD